MLPTTPRAPSTRSLLLRSASLIGLGAAALAPTVAQAASAGGNTTSYVGPTSDANWSDGANWTNGVPNSGSATTVNNGQTVNTDGGNATNTLTVGNTSGVSINSGTSLTVSTGINNSGLISFNPYYGTGLLTNGTVTLNGGGTVQLGANGNSNGYIGGTGSLANVDNAIIGTGTVGNGQISIDNGAGAMINANAANAILTLNPTSLTNEGRLQASAGGTLAVNNTTVTQSGAGTILSTGAGSAVNLSATSVTGGTLKTASGGVMNASNNTTLTNLTVSSGSTVNTTNGSATYLGGTITNNGILTTSAYYGTEYRVAAGATTTLTGSGTLLLGGNGNSYVRDADASTGTLNNVNNTITGSGNLGNGQLGIVNGAAGLIDAAAGNTLSVQSNSLGVANSGTLRASGGGTLNINSSAVTQTGGTVLSTGAGSTVTLNSSTINGGTLTTTNNGVFATSGNNHLANVTVSAGSTFTNTDQANTYLDGTTTNRGTLVTNSYYGSDFRVGAGATSTLTGGGTLTLNGANTFLRDADAGTGTLINIDNTINGYGHLGNGQLGIQNQAAGTINANSTGNTLTLATNSQGLLNASTVGATNGGTLNIQNTTVNQTPAGVISAVGAVTNGGTTTPSTVTFTNSTVNGGTLATSGGGVLNTSGTNSLNNVRLSSGSALTGNDQTITYLGGTVTNQGTVNLNSFYGSELRVGAGVTTTLTGGGVVSMNGQNTYFRDADSATGTLVNTNNTIQGIGNLGNGQLGIQNQAGGTINANNSGGTLYLSANSQGVTNAGAVLASNGGTLNIQNTTVNQTGAGNVLAATGSTVTLANSTINSGTLSTAGTGLLQTSGTNNLNNVTLTTGSTLTGNDQTITYLGGTFTNNGTVNLNSFYGSELRVGAGSTTTLTGGGVISMNGQNTFLRDADASTGTLVNTNNTIQGIGNLGNGQLGIDNRVNGVINANNPGGTLYLQGNGPSTGNTNLTGVSNAGLVEATNGGTLQVNSTTLNQAGTGTLLAANASTVVLANSTINGGTLTTAGTGSMVTSGTNSINNTTLSTGSTLTARDQTTTYLGGTINNQGTINANGYYGSELRVGAGSTTTLTGGGTVSLNGNVLFRDADASTGTLNNVDNTITGNGQLGNGQLAIVNGAAGTIVANGATLPVNTNGAGLTNNGILQATNGGTLNVTGGPLNNYAAGTLTGGTYRADANSTVNLNTAGITTNAATVVLNGTGSAVNTQAGAIETTLTANAQGGSLQILNNRNYSTANDLTNSGAVQLGGGTLAPNSLTNTATGTVTGFGTTAPTNGSALANAGTVVAQGGTLALATGISSTGTLQSNTGATASLAAGPASNTVGRLNLNGGSLALGTNAVTVSSDYTNTAFGTGNSFNKRANVTGTGAINASGNVALSISGAGVANGSSATPTLNLGNFHTTDAAHATGGASTTFQINNTGTTGPAIRGAVQTTGITDARLSGSGITAGNFGPIAAGGSASYTVNVAGSGAGTLTGQSIHIANNFSNVAEQTVAITGTGYNYAQATNATGSTVNLGNVHVGATSSASLSIGNTAPTGAYTEKLDGSAGATTGNATAAGSFTGLAAGSSSSAVSVGLNTATAGAKSGTVTLNFTSNAAGVDSLGNSALPSQTVTVTGAAYNLASSSTIAPVNFGVLHTGTGTQTRTLSVTNTAPTGAYSEGLDSSFGSYTNNGGTIGVTAAGSFANLAAGATNNSSLTLSVSTAQAGTVSGTIQVHQASNGTIDGLGNTALPDQNPAVSGTVQATVTNLAQAQINTAQPVSFGNVRIGTTQQQALSITNAAPAGQYSEGLVASVAGTSGGVTATGGFGPPSSVPSLAAQATDTTHVVVGINTNTAGAKSGNATLNFQSDGTAFQGGTLTNLGNTNVAVTGNVFRLASPTVNTPGVTLAARVGGTASTAISVTNTSPDSFTEGLKAGTAAAPANFTSTGAIGNLSAGSTDVTTLRVGLNTGAAGTFTGTQTLNFASTGAGTTGAADATLASGSVSLTGKVYAAATASVSPMAVSFGTVHVGDTVTRALTVGNAATGALTDVLTGGFGAVSSGFTGTGTLGTGVAAGSTSNALTIGLDTSASGSHAGTAAFAFNSHDADLADIAAAAGPVSLSGTVDNYALSGFGFTSGAGSFSGSANSYTLDFGTVTQGSSALMDMLYAGNFATGLADLLSGSFSTMGSSDFSLAGFNPFSGLGAGQDTGPLSVSFGTGSLGTFVDTITLAGIGSNSSGYSGTVADTTLTLRGTVVAASGGGGGTTPVPEPGTLAVLGSALAALFAFRRRFPRDA